MSDQPTPEEFCELLGSLNDQDAIKAIAERDAVIGAEIESLKAQLAKAKERYERAETQLSGCGVAALGWNDNPAKQGDWGWSPSYQDVLDLRRRWEESQAQLAEAKAQVIDALRVVE